MARPQDLDQGKTSNQLAGRVGQGKYRQDTDGIGWADLCIWTVTIKTTMMNNTLDFIF